MKLPSPIHYLAQKLLYLWINTEVIKYHEVQEADKNTIIIYVLASRSCSDLLVLEQECRLLNLTRPRSRIKSPALKKWHHVYALAQANPVKAWLQQRSKNSAMLNGIYQALLDNPELDVRFIPVVVFWGRPVLKQKHWLRVLFSDTWGIAGRSRRFFTILLNGRNTLVELSSAICFRQIINNCSDQRSAVDLLQNRLSERLIEIKTATLGPDISHRHTLVRSLLDNENISRAISERCISDNISEYKARKIALAYLNEIVADRNYITIQILQRILTAFWNRFYAGIEVFFSARLKQLALSHEFIYVPCHRSHVDYLLLSYVIHSEGLAIPCIAAGKNLNMPVIGPILRKGGAFFIRRSFKGNALYSTVLFEYLASQVATGMPVEYFIEGGRSRTGRLLQPKPGLLAMTIRSYLKYQKKPLAFIPVYIGYEKMIESKSYLSELKGDDKKSETLLGSIRSLLKIRGFYGRVTTSFGEPVLLHDILNSQCPDWQQQSYDDRQRPQWLRPAVEQCAQLIMQRINECCAVNPVNLIATALLAAPNQTMDENDLMRNISLYQQLITQLKYSSHIRLPQTTAIEQIHYVETLNVVHRRQHEMGDFIYLDNTYAIRLTYYRNNILHLLAIPSLIASCFINASTLSSDKINRFIKIAYPFLRSEFFLPWPETSIETLSTSVLQYLSGVGLLTYNEAADVYSKPRISTEQHAMLSTLARIISPVLELYYMIFALLAEHGSDTLSRERLEQLCHLMAQRLSLMYEINSPDFFDKKLITNFIDSLIRLHYVEINDSGKLEMSDVAISEGRHARRLLDKNMQYNILQMLTAATSNQ